LKFMVGNIMPTLQPTTNPPQWKSLNLDRILLVWHMEVGAALVDVGHNSAIKN
jgi:hypothetical protein